VGNQHTLLLCDPHTQRCCLDWVEVPALVLKWGQVQELQWAQVLEAQLLAGLEWMVQLD
jgi:hypothetical protein